MAVLRPEVQFNFEGLDRLKKQFPELNGMFLAMVGKRARVLLKEKYLSGQVINLDAYPTDKFGRYTVKSSVGKRRKQTTISSYPMNLFERGRILRSGRKEPGKYVITRKLKQDISSRMASYTKEFEIKILQGELDEMGLG